MDDLDLKSLTETQAAGFRRLEEAQSQYLNVFNEVWATILQQQQALTQQLQREHARNLSEMMNKKSGGSCA